MGGGGKRGRWRWTTAAGERGAGGRRAGARGGKAEADLQRPRRRGPGRQRAAADAPSGSTQHTHRRPHGGPSPEGAHAEGPRHEAPPEAQRAVRAPRHPPHLWGMFASAPFLHGVTPPSPTVAGSTRRHPPSPRHRHTYTSSLLAEISLCCSHLRIPSPCHPPASPSTATTSPSPSATATSPFLRPSRSSSTAAIAVFSSAQTAQASPPFSAFSQASVSQRPATARSSARMCL